MMSTAPRGSFLMRGPMGMCVQAMSSGFSSFAKRARLLDMKMQSFLHHPTSVRDVSKADLPRSRLHASRMSGSLSWSAQ